MVFLGLIVCDVAILIVNIEDVMEFSTGFMLSEASMSAGKIFPCEIGIFWLFFGLYSRFCMVFLGAVG